MEIEKKLGERDLIVSSTDKQGIICYVNKTFEDISEYSKDELYGQPHNVIRHPDMPKAVFRYIWNSLSSHKPVVAYVKNYVKDHHSYYWVKAVMYPKVTNNEITNITSYRTKATDFEIEQIKVIYRYLTDYEKSHSVDESYNYFLKFLEEKDLTYERMINRLNDKEQVLNTTLLQIDIQKFKTDYMIFRGRIESLVEKEYDNIIVARPEESEFGKRLMLLEHENFSNNPEFLEVKRLHFKVHEELELFVKSETLDSRTLYMKNVYKDIDQLFIVLENLKNNDTFQTRTI